MMNNNLTFEKIQNDLSNLVASMFEIKSSDMSDKNISGQSIAMDRQAAMFRQHQCTIIQSWRATKNSKDRNFKKSKHRRKRLHKKLLKKFDGHEFKQEPAIYINGNNYIVHPALYADARRVLNYE